MSRVVNLMAIAAAACSLAQPASAYPLDGAIQDGNYRTGGMAAVRLQVPFHVSRHGARAGLVLGLHTQSRSPAGVPTDFRTDAFELTVRHGRPALFVNGIEPGSTGEKSTATADDRKSSPWKTIGWVLGAAAVGGGVYLLHLVHEADKNSD